MSENGAGKEPEGKGSDKSKLDLTDLIRRVREGDMRARDDLFQTAYPELRKLARSRLRDGGRNTYLETTALVHESYLRFLSSGDLRIDDRRAFFAYASKTMRSVIIDTIRKRKAEIGGGGLVKVTLTPEMEAGSPSGEREIMLVHDALLALEEIEPRLAKVVEMRYFGGYSEIEIAEALGITERTVNRDWNRARLLLRDSLTE